MDEPRYKHYQGGRFLGRFEDYDLYDKLVENKQGTRILYAQYGDDSLYKSTPDYVVRAWGPGDSEEPAKALREALRRSDEDKTLGRPFFQDMCDRHMLLGHTFLGPFEAEGRKFDLYFKPGDAPSVLARWGEGGDFTETTYAQAQLDMVSGSIHVCMDAVYEAVRRTEARGLVANEPGGIRALTHVYVLTNVRERTYNESHVETDVKGVFTSMAGVRKHMTTYAESHGCEMREVPMDPPYVCRYEDDPGDEDYHMVEKMELK